MGRLDIVVANAGLCDWQTVAELSAELWDRLVGVNLHGAFNTCRAAAAQMRARRRGWAGSSSRPRCTRRCRSR